MPRKAFFAAIVCGLIAIAVQPMSAGSSTPSLAGSWQFVLTPTSPTPPVLEIAGLVTFTTDGSAVETDGSELASIPNSSAAVPKTASPGHGIWQLGNTPASLYVEYISLVLNKNGSLFARNVTTMLVALDATTGTTFTGSYTTDQVIGTVTKTISSGTVNGVLIPHVPLP
jgi:hypothetical protein